MERDAVEETKWSELPILCPHCGSHGEPDGEWTANGWTPFKLIEEVIRSFAFSANVDDQGTLSLTADVETDDVDWESGANLRIECLGCFGEFPLPENAQVDFDS